MQKAILPIALSALVISACGGSSGSDNAPTVSGVTSQPVTANPFQQPSNDFAEAPDTQSPGTQTPDDETSSPQAEQSTTLSESSVVPQPGPCVDAAPLNDGWGWNGANTCQLSVSQADAEILAVSQWSDRTWNCVSTIPEITARWQLQINQDRTFFDLSRPDSDPLRVGSWTDNGGAGFTTTWADDRTYVYQSMGAGFIENTGSRCHEDFFPERPEDNEPDEQSLPVLAEGSWDYPVFFCQAWSDPNNVWAWALSPDGHVRNENRIIAGSYVFQSDGLQLFITNHEGEQTQWSAVDFESLTISWGGCAHVAGPTLRTADLSPSNADYCAACH